MKFHIILSITLFLFSHTLAEESFSFKRRLIKSINKIGQKAIKITGKGITNFATQKVGSFLDDDNNGSSSGAQADQSLTNAAINIPLLAGRSKSLDIISKNKKKIKINKQSNGTKKGDSIKKGDNDRGKGHGKGSGQDGHTIDIGSISIGGTNT